MSSTEIPLKRLREKGKEEEEKSQPSSKKIKREPTHYLLCGVHPDQTGILNGYIYTPGHSKRGNKLMDYLLEPDQTEQGEMLLAFIDLMHSRDPKHPLHDTEHKIPKVLTDVVPDIGSKNYLGTMEPWFQEDRKAVVVVYYDWDY